MAELSLVEEQPSRRERRRLETRVRIVETALELFETQGYEATTVTEIARRADIAYGTFFNHFPSKLHLLREVSDLALQDLFENVEDVQKRPGSFADHLISLFEKSAQTAEEKGPQTRELISAMMALAFPETAGNDDRRIRLAFRHFLEEGLAAGEVRRDVDLDTLTEIVVGTWYSMFLSWVHLDDYPLRARASKAARFLSRTITEPGRLAELRTPVSQQES
jgi:AcrR family transcriptional regulator